MNTEPKSIDTAPIDGTVILTDKGIAKAELERDFSSKINSKKLVWVLCFPDGCAPQDADWGLFYCHPTKWTRLPEWVQ